MSASDYYYSNSGENLSHAYLLPTLISILEHLEISKTSFLLDLGCGNGFIADKLNLLGYNVEGIDPSKIGIEIARKDYPKLNLTCGSSSDLINLGKHFDCIYSLEVIEHVYDPYDFIKNINRVLENSGYLVISTPYHSYLKNLALSLSAKMDAHFTALWNNGHIKFWSKKTISQLLLENGFHIIDFRRIGRIPILAKSMVIVAKKSKV